MSLESLKTNYPFHLLQVVCLSTLSNHLVVYVLCKVIPGVFGDCATVLATHKQSHVVRLVPQSQTKDCYLTEDNHTLCIFCMYPYLLFQDRIDWRVDVSTKISYLSLSVSGSGSLLLSLKNCLEAKGYLSNF